MKCPTCHGYGKVRSSLYSLLLDEYNEFVRTRGLEHPEMTAPFEAFVQHRYGIDADALRKMEWVTCPDCGGSGKVGLRDFIALKLLALE